ncbi:hypothetical protein DPEC_G00226570 [Dallia pectoralis]|uniref:Uncharacterized protein n=1 Tax=Dallia pectoralis TaxID=75939 RepID=A0ACC2G0W2_DALPE|nr:hypothetical protein DPEC_G00226570 [Dallia pectoralis]
MNRVEIHKLKSEEENEPPRIGFPGQDAYSTSITKRKPSTDSVGLGTPPPRRAVKTIKPSEEPRFTSLAPLEEAEHRWLVGSATGQWTRVYGLLLNDLQLAEKRDFLSGFTALHWAAKFGNLDMVRKIINTSRKGGLDLDVNARAYGGYTPLHIAALHNQESVLTELMCEYGANANIRDNCGKKPFHYLQSGVSVQVREMLGQPKAQAQDIIQQEKEEQDVLPGLHTISRLFQPHVEKKKRHRQRPGFLSLSDDPRERGVSPNKYIPISEVFL